MRVFLWLEYKHQSPSVSCHDYEAVIFPVGIGFPIVVSAGSSSLSEGLNKEAENSKSDATDETVVHFDQDVELVCLIFLLQIGQSPSVCLNNPKR